MENNFNISRLLNFIRRQAVLNIRSLLISAGATFGALLVVTALVSHFNPEAVPGLIKSYLTVFYICGLIFTSKVFSELHYPQKSYAYLTLPVSVSEKLIGSWILASPVFVALFYLIIVLLYTIACATGNRFDAFDQIFALNVWKSIATFMVVQSVFFLGAVYFRKNNFMKTIFSLFLITLVIAMYTGFIAWMMWGGEKHVQTNFNLGNIAEFPSQVIKFAFWALLGPFMLVVSYFRLKETQV